MLSYDKFLDSVVNKTTKKLHVFRKITRSISIDTAIVVYKQMILPLLEHCNFLLNSGKKCKLDEIDKVQSKCLRIIENCYYTGDRKKENVLCKDYNIDSLQRRRDNIQLACLMNMFSKREYCIDSNVKTSYLHSEKNNICHSFYTCILMELYLRMLI